MPKTSRRIGELTENRVTVWDIASAQQIFREGYYGKPLGIPKPKNFDFEAPLVLDLIEAYYLTKEKKISIRRSTDHKKVTQKQIEEICQSSYTDFKEKYLVYSQLRKKGYVVTPGIKFGCDFAIYEHGPGIDHAPYLVNVLKPADVLTATGIVLSGRLATTVKKQFIIAVADSQKGKVDFFAFDWWRA
ncbi:MAG: tRNA-intron lyase [Thaumarchaeota archaeon]|nr:tRNA-intron lyase [Nitrososphaerota archaeon]